MKKRNIEIALGQNISSRKSLLPAKEQILLKYGFKHDSEVKGNEMDDSDWLVYANIYEAITSIDNTYHAIYYNN